MGEAQREIWKERLEKSFRESSGEQRVQLINEQLSELWEIAPIIVRVKNSQNCSDGCCDLDQWVMEEYASHHYAQLANVFRDNAIKPLWRIVLDVED